MSPREIDALVAEKLMGWSDIASLPTALGSDLHGVDPSGHVKGLMRIPSYSTDIAAAFEVVAKMRADGYVFEFSNQDSACATFWKVYHRDERIGRLADAPPLAICRAALKVMGVEVPS